MHGKTLTLRAGDYVFYAANPTLYGLMSVREVRRRSDPDKAWRVVCRVDEGRSKALPTYELFDVTELMLPTTVPGSD